MHVSSAFLALFLTAVCGQVYTPDWESIDSRPLPSWYDEAKVGIFMHFGVYSVPGIESEWFWQMSVQNTTEAEQRCWKYMHDFFPPRFTYQDFGPMLQMEFFDAAEIARIVAGSGAKYLVFTSKHHDGFCNWPSTYSYGWNSMDIGPRRDVIGELKTAFQSEAPDVHFGLYYSLYEWFNPIYLLDKANGYDTREYVTNKMLPELRELINTYAPDLLWADGDWEVGPEYWGSLDFLAWLYNESPSRETIVTNDRWGSGSMMTHGGYYSGPDRFSPGSLQAHKWENAMTVDQRSWGIRRDIRLQDVFATKDIISLLASTISCGGNILINVGPTKEGTIIPIFQERLSELGQWLELNGEAIYASTPWTFQNDSSGSQVWYTTRATSVYGIVLDWPANDVLRVSSPSVDPAATSITLLGVQGELAFSVGVDDVVSVEFPPMSQVVQECGRVCELGYVLRFDGLLNLEGGMIDRFKP